MYKRYGSLLNLFLALSMILALVTVPLAGNAAAQPPPPDTPKLLQNPSGMVAAKMIEELSQKAAIEKIDPLLREAAQNGGKDYKDVLVSVKGSAMIEDFMIDVIARPSVFPGMSIYIGKVRAGDLLRLAQEPGVLSIADSSMKDLRPPADPEQAGAPDLAAKLTTLNQLRANELTYQEAQAKADSLGAQGWFDVLDGHKSSEAWKKGFTGQDVIVGVIDDGIDFAHPDLQGTYAVVTDPDSPYYGWPMSFSQTSMEYWVFDVLYGTDYIASNAATSRWTDAQTTVEAHPSFEGRTARVSYKPVGSGIAHSYTIPTTSLSDQYKFGSFPEANLQDLYGESPAVLVVDEHSAGKYDTVYVDLDNDYDFTDEKPATKDDPTIYRDMNGDGYADISGGILTWISDGGHTPPAADWLWGVTCSDSSATMQGCPDAGDLVLFAGPFTGGYTHGTQCASNVAGQGVVAGGLDAQPFREGGMVQGGAPDVGLMDFGDFYYSFVEEDNYIVAALGYDGIPGSGDEVQIASNSYGAFRQMWGSWGYIGRLLTALNLSLAPQTAFVFSAGNEGPGYGPQEGDSSPTTILAGSSSQYGSTNWDSIVRRNQIMYGDPSSFYSKGPNNDGTAGVDILGNGGRGSGDEGLNYFGFDGWTSWDTWGGTSRSSPVVSGNLALIYQAYKARYGEWPTWDVAKALLKNGATNSVSSPFLQGGGVVNADRATDLAAGIYGVYATPDEWDVGNWQGEEYLNFAKVAQPGDSYTKTYTIQNPSGYDIDVDLSDGYMQLMGSSEFTFTTSSESLESPFNFHSPDYLMKMDPSLIPSDAEVMIVRYVHPYSTFDPDYSFSPNPESSWRFLLYNWTDVNLDGELWVDQDGNGVVNHVGNGEIDNDGFERLDFSQSEIEEGEYIRVDYEFGGLGIPIVVHNPLARMADGYYFGFQHRYNAHIVDKTTFKIGVEFYKRADWPWLSLSASSLAVSANSSADFVATATIPSDAQNGSYEGVIFMNDPGMDSRHPAHETALPVVVNVLADLPDDGSLTFGGEPMADTMYQNSWTNGYFNWYGGGWTGAGEWRHYFFNVDQADVANKNLLIHTSWTDPYPTDINTWVLGPTPDCASNAAGPCAWYEPGIGQPDSSVFGPYTLQPIGSSGPFLSGAAYPFDTSTGGPDDWLKVPLDTAGLHELALHNVEYSGENLAAQFKVDVGTIDLSASVMPDTGLVVTDPDNIDVYTDTGKVDFAFTPTIDLPDLSASLTGGLATDQFNVSTFAPNSNQCGSGASCAETQWTSIEVTQVGTTQLEVFVPSPGSLDIDVYLYRDVNGNGVFDSGTDALVGSSTQSAGNDEDIKALNPALGKYLVGVLGWDVTDPGVNVDWWWAVTYPGGLPTSPDTWISQTVSIDQDSKFDPMTASYSTTLTADERTAGIHIALTGIPSGSDADLYLTDTAGDLIAKSQTEGNADEMIDLAPTAPLYRFGDGTQFTLWVHGFDVPAGPITPTLKVTVDELNLWLSADSNGVTVNSIGAGETVTATLNFEKAGWMPGDSDLSARFLASPSVLPNAFDELVILHRTDKPAESAPDATFSKSIETKRGPSPFLASGYPTALVDDGEYVTYTLSLTNSGNAAGTYYLEDWMAHDWYTDFVSVSSPVPFGLDYTMGSWDVYTATAALAPGESTEIVYRVTAVNATAEYGWTVYNYLDVYNGNTMDQYGEDVNAMYFRSFRTTGSMKLSDPSVVAPGETFQYTISLANPSSEDRDVYVSDPLPAEVQFVSVTPASAQYDAGSHTVTWSGSLPGTSLSTVDITIDVMMKSDVPEGTVVDNEAAIALKFEGTPIDTLAAETLVDDGKNPDLVISKTVDHLVGTPGSTLKYTIVAENTGDEAAMNAEVTDIVPADLEVDEASITGGATYADGIITWTGDIGVGESVTITFNATISESATDDLALINGADVMADNFLGHVFHSAVTEVREVVKFFVPLAFK
jgi:uncharacterized repeat protein (TIGR01451 family)